jgi:quercetin dioxygenase-like cupin family protein
MNDEKTRSKDALKEGHTMSNQNQVKHVPAGGGPTFWGPGDRTTFLLTGAETGGAFFLCEAMVPHGGGPPPHVHNREDESFYIQEGTLTIQAGGKTINASAGDFVYLPRGIMHSFQNTGKSKARLLVLATPAGLEKFFEETFDPARDSTSDPPPPSEAMIARFMAAAPKYGLEIMLPAGAHWPSRIAHGAASKFSRLGREAFLGDFVSGRNTVMQFRSVGNNNSRGSPVR